jgi:mRNA interferase MazF
VVSGQRKADWTPDRQDVIWIDCNPQAGREMRDIHPFLVLSHGTFNERTSLVIGLPMTTAEYNSDNPFAVAAGVAKGSKEGKTSYVPSLRNKLRRVCQAHSADPYAQRYHFWLHYVEQPAA